MTKAEWDVLGKRVRRVRRQQDLTSEDLAQRAGTSRMLISALENSRKPRVSFDIVFRVAQALNISLDYLAGRKDDDTVATPAA